MATLNVCETFTSIQGESSWAGMVCHFIRLAGCNLRCRYCDTDYARAAGHETTLNELVDGMRQSGAAMVEITGGEPLCQPALPLLAAALRDDVGNPVLVETNGSLDISVIPEGVTAIVDVKCPGSGEGASFDAANLDRLRPNDEVKFVLTDRADYDWAKAFVARHRMAARGGVVLFGGVSGRLDPAQLAGWILEDRLPVRLQVQLHRLLGLK